MKHRDDRDLENAVESVRYHTIRPATSGEGGGRRLALEVQLNRARTLITRAASASAKLDGFSSTTPGNGNPGGGKGGRKLMSVPDDKGGVDLVPTSSTETAALTTGAKTDQITAMGAEARALLISIGAAFDRLDQLLGRAENVQSTAKIADPPMCWVAQVKYGLPWDIEWEPYRARTDLGGLLDEPHPVSKYVYIFWRNHQALPSKEQMLEYVQRGVNHITEKPRYHTTSYRP